MQLDSVFWNTHYMEGNTPWDLGKVSPPLKSFIDLLPDKNIRILIPGAGRAYEAIYLHRQGFGQVFVCDWASGAFEMIRQEEPDFPSDHLIVGDFFKLEGEFDLLLEQTFFCAILPALRKDYIRQVNKLLSPGGEAAGILFASHFQQEGPPFGGTIAEYKLLMEPWFKIKTLEICQNSIPPRAGNEVFFHISK